MALSKDLEIGRGYVASYHRVGEIIVDRLSNVTALRVDSYRDKEMRDANAVADTRIVVIQGAPSGEAAVWAYDQLKVEEGFIDAKDV